MKMYWLPGITIAFVAFLIVEAFLLKRARLGIPIRIVVTGTRGKSSLVKILVAGIRAVEPATWGKITGDEPLLLKPSGTAEPLVRRGPARLHEQAKILTKCHQGGARCLVLESMTISPEAMEAEMRLVRPTLVVMTNVRDDHRETLGEHSDQQRAAYLDALPADCRWLTLDPELADFAWRSGGYPQPAECTQAARGKTTASKRGFVTELLETAEAVLEEMELNTEPARMAMLKAAEELPHTPREVDFQGSRMQLLDAFSANDPESLSRVWDGWRDSMDDPGPWSVLLSTRADRPLRTRQFCDWLAARSDVGTVHLAGSHQATAARLLQHSGVNVKKMDSSSSPVLASGAVSDRELEVPGVLVGIGNSRGLGMNLRVPAQGAVA